ncbi:MAG: hypothetical protein ACOY4U_11310 [Pseudomonadota bacterium]
MTWAEINAFSVQNKSALDFFSALLPFVLSVIAAYIAFAQWRVNKNKLKLDLFEKRFQVFTAAKDFIAHCLTNGYRPTQEAKHEFLQRTKGAEFLFNKKVKELVDEIWSKSVELEGYSYDQNTAEHAKERHACATWLSNKLNSINKDFAPFMSLRH